MITTIFTFYSKGDITILGHATIQVAFKNCAPFLKCITKIDGTTLDDNEGLYLVILLYNFIEYNCNYSDRKGSLWF